MVSAFRYAIVVLSTIWCFCTTYVSHAQVPELAPVPNHPRLMLKAEDVEAINMMVDANSEWADLHQFILNECDHIITLPQLERIQEGRRLLEKSREALRRIFYLSYAYKTTSQKKYLERAEQELLTVAAFSDWNPSHFLDVAEMTMAVAIGYDWLYHDLDPKARDIIKKAIINHGLEPSYDSRYNSWLRASHNWNQVCNAGMAFGAIAVYEDQPDRSKEIIQRAVDTIKLPMKDYGPDGDYPEGYGYWAYGTGFNVMLLDVLEKLYQTDFGLSKAPGFLETAGYMKFMTGPSGDAFNYADSRQIGYFQPAMFWFAQKINDPSIVFLEQERLKNKDEQLGYNRLLPAVMLWSLGMDFNQKKQPDSKIWVGNGKNPVALMRTSWTDPNAIYVGFKGGSPSVNHAHMDIGSFVMEANGVRWAIDFGMQSYKTLESKGVQLWGTDQNSQRWEIFRYTNRVHNTLTIDDKLQQVSGYASFQKHSSHPDFLSAVTDLSSIYTGQLQQVKRGIAVIDNEYVLIRDEFQNNAIPSTIRWNMLTTADVMLKGNNEAILNQDGKKLILKVAEPAKVTMKTWSTDPPKDYDAPNPGTIMVGFEIEVPANYKGVLSVFLIPKDKTKTAKPKAFEQWK